jgi:hypothetical protein
MAKKRAVRLTEGERALLQRRISAGSAPVSVQTDARPPLPARLGRGEREVAAWEAERDSLGGKVDRRLATEDARINLKRPYPSLGV